MAIDIAISILIYCILAMTLYLTGKSAHQCIIRRNKSADVILICAGVVFSLMCGLRYSVGVDCESYATTYNDLLQGTSIETILRRNLIAPEQGFIFLMRFFAAFGAPVFVFMGFLAFLEYSFFFKAFKKRSFLLPYLGAILILGPFFLSWMNGIRQAIASCIFVFAMQLLVDKKQWVWYLLLIGLAVLIHKSALILLPFIFLVFYDHQPNKMLLTGILIVCFFLGQFSGFSGYSQYLEDVLPFLNYSGYSENLESFADETANINFGLRSTMSLLSFLIVIMYSDNLFRSFRRDRFFKVSYLMSFVYACLFLLTFSMNSIFKRPMLYMMPFVLICQAYSLFLMRRRKHFTLLLVSSIAFCSYTILENVLGAASVGETVLFKFMIR